MIGAIQLVAAAVLGICAVLATLGVGVQLVAYVFELEVPRIVGRACWALVVVGAFAWVIGRLADRAEG